MAKLVVSCWWISLWLSPSSGARSARKSPTSLHQVLWALRCRTRLVTNLERIARAYEVTGGATIGDGEMEDAIREELGKRT
jgi:hypothetical protein